MEELIALTKKMADDEIHLGVLVLNQRCNWWPATDWMEDIMLRTHTPDVYDNGFQMKCHSMTKK